MSVRAVTAGLVLVIALATGVGGTVAGGVDVDTTATPDETAALCGEPALGTQNVSGVTAERTVNTTEPEPGETVRVTGTVGLNSKRTIDYLDEFTPNLNSTELVSVTLDGTTVGTDLEIVGDGEVLISVSDVGPGNLEFVYDVVVPTDAAGTTYTLEGAAQVDSNDTVRMNDSQLVVTPPTSEFDVNITAITDEIPAGESATVEAVVSNTGDAAGEQDVRFSVDGAEQATDRVRLAEGERKTVSFDYRTNKTDTPGITVAVATANDTASEQVTVLDPAAFEVTLDSVNSTVVAGETVSVEATVTNSGTVNATQDVRFSVDGVEQATDRVTLAGGASEQLSFDYQTDETDRPEITVGVSSENSAASRMVSVLAPAAFGVTLDSVDSTVVAGETVSVEGTVRNTGETATSQEVAFSVNGTEQETTNLTVGVDEQETVSFAYETSDTDLPAVTVGVSSEDDAVTETVVVQEPAVFAVELGSIRQEVAPGEQVTVNATVTNEGDVTGTQTLRFSAGGTEQETRTLSLDSGQRETVSFDYNTSTEDPFALELTVASTNEEVSEILNVVGSTTFAVSVETVEEVAAGERVTVAYTVENVGAVEGTQTVRLSAGGVEQARETVTLAVDERINETYTYRTDPTDAPAVVVAAESANDTAEQTVAVATVASLTVTDLSHTGPVVAGEDLELTATLSNEAGVPITTTAQITVRSVTGTVLDSFNSSVTVDATGTTTLTATYTADRNSTPEVSADVALAGETRAGVEVPVTEPPRAGPFTIAVETVDEAATAELIPVNYTVENTGNISGSQTVSLRVNGTTVNSTTTTVPGGGVSTGSFGYRVTEEDRPSIAITVVGENSTDTAVVTVEQTNSSNNNTAPTGSDDSGPGFVPVTVLVAVALLSGYALTRRLRDETP
jgi:hypothetical protein